MSKIIRHNSAGVRRYLSRQAAKHAGNAAAFGVGGSCMPRQTGTSNYGTGCPPTPEVQGCIRPGRTCDVGRIGTTKVVAGGSTFDITITPRRLPWFQPTGVRATITDLGNADLQHRVLITSVKVGGEPQLTVDEQSPTLPTAVGNTIEGFWSDDWIDPDGWAVPVNWDWCSNSANERELVVYGAALGYSSSTELLVSISLYGNAAQSPPNM